MNQKLYELIKKAQGDRTQNTFAFNCGINSATLTRILNGENNPKPDILKKISSHAHNGVTYNSLMEAAGYIDISTLAIPDNMRDVPVAFHGGMDGFTQEQINEVSQFIEFIKNKNK